MNLQENTSTPKRRRLGTGRILKPSLRLSKGNKKNSVLHSNYSPIHRQITSTITSSAYRCESPPLPSNQNEYISNSRNNSTNDNPCSPVILESSVSMKSLKDGRWDSLSTSNLGDICNNEVSEQEILNEIEDISDDMFQSRLEQESSQLSKQVLNKNSQQLQSEASKSTENHADKSFTQSKLDSSFVSGNALLDLKLDQSFDNEMMTSRCEKQFREDIEESFELINQSICGVHEDNKKSEKSSLFETKDSFLLDIKESGILRAEQNSEQFVKPRTPKADKDNSFYGLPMITKSLFKTYRNIEKFYDWQEECLSLDAIKERRNLIYALPTSGGKTLVAEVLMLREVLNRKKNALFILPFVALVQEKIWSLSPFAIKLDFLVEEYAAGKGHLPPKKRRKKNSIYIATIEKGLALLRGLIELGRLEELGLIVVDELHLIGEQGRGGTLETLLTTAIFADKGIQIVGMSATIGNLPQLAAFLRADVFERHFRPVELAEYVKLGGELHRLVWPPIGGGLEVVPHRKLAYEYSAAALALDPDYLGGLVSEVVNLHLSMTEKISRYAGQYSPAALALDPDYLGGLVSEVVPLGSCLVFCPTKRNCENVAALLCKLQRRSGVISVICCTSTLAAGVNLPARRVIIRAPLVGREFITLAAYRQMAGRAGRAGVCEAGESIILCSPRDWERLGGVLRGGLAAATSQLPSSAPALLLSAVALKLATTRVQLRRMLECTLLATSSDLDLKQLCDESIRSLIQSDALQVSSKSQKEVPENGEERRCYVHDDAELVVSKLGKAAITGCMDLGTAKQLLDDIEVASRGLVLMGSLHLIYLVTPYDAAGVRPDYIHYYSLYGNLDEEGIQTAKILGITEMNAIRMMTGKPITNIPEMVLRRFYLALMLHDLWKQVPFPVVADKYNVARGTLQLVMTSAAGFASSAHKLCEELELSWFSSLFGVLATRLQHCAAPELLQLMQLPAVKKARALQLMRAGFKRIEDVARADVEQLLCVEHLSRSAAAHLVSAARMMLIEKVENLRAEAEDVMEELNV